MAKSSDQYVEIQWRIVALECPRVVRPCPQCRRTRPFHCTEKFRVNAQKRRVDVWLLYRCGECGTSWKASIFERCLPDDIADFHRYQNNDAKLARSYAFDRAWLRCFSDDIDEAVAFRIDASDSRESANLRIAIAFEDPLRIRLDRLLAMGLETSRSRVVKLWNEGAIVPLNGQELRRPARDGGIVEVRRQ